MKKMMKKTISIFLVMIIAISALQMVVYAGQTKPSVFLSSPSVSSVNAGGTVSYTVTYYNAEDVYLSASYVNLNGFTANVSVSGSGNTRTVTLSNVQGTAGSGKSISLNTNSAHNDAGYTGATPNSVSFTLNATGTVTPTNPSTPSTPAATTVATRPSVFLSSPSASSVNAGGTVSYTVTYYNAEDIYLSAPYVNLNGFTANVNVSGSGNTRTVTLSNVQGTAGSKTISIKTNSAHNGAGYTGATPNSVAFALDSASTVVTGYQTRPSVFISNPSVSTITAGGIVTYTITYYNAEDIYLSADYINLNGFTADVSVSGSGNTRTITLSNVQGTIGSAKTISIKTNSAHNGVGYTGATPNSVAFSIIAGNADNTPVNNTNVDNEPYTGVKPVSVVLVMGTTVAVLAAAWIFVSKKYLLKK